MLSVVAVVVGVGAGVVKQETTARPPAGWQEAWGLFQQGKTLDPADPKRIQTFEEATKAFEAVAERERGSWAAEALMMAGLCRDWLSDYQGAAGRYERSLRDYQGQGGSAARIYLAQTYQALGRNDDAKAQAQTLLDLGRKGHVPKWQAVTARAILEGREPAGQKPHRYDEAWGLFQKGKAMPPSPERDAVFEKSQKVYEEIAQEARGMWSGDALMMAGLCRNWVRDYPGAITFYEQALRTHGDVLGPAIHYYLASAYLYAGRKAEARRQAQAILDLAKSGRQEVGAWEIDRAQGIMSGKLTAASQALVRTAGDAYSRGQAAKGDARAKAMQEAKAAYLRAADASEGHTKGQALKMAAVCCDWLHDPAASVQYLEQARVLSVDAQNTDILAYLIDDYIELGRFDDARAVGRELRKVRNPNTLPDWQAPAFALAASDDQTLMKAQGLLQQMRALQRNNGSGGEESAGAFEKLRDQLDGLAPGPKAGGS